MSCYNYTGLKRSTEELIEMTYRPGEQGVIWQQKIVKSLVALSELRLLLIGRIEFEISMSGRRVEI